MKNNKGKCKGLAQNQKMILKIAAFINTMN